MDAKTADQSATATPPFFKLPRELRDIIYSFAWFESIYQFPRQDLDFYVSLCDPRIRKGWVVGLPNWLRTCRLLQKEGMDYFYKSAVGAHMKLLSYPERSSVRLDFSRLRNVHVALKVAISVRHDPKLQQDTSRFVFTGLDKRGKLTT